MARIGTIDIIQNSQNVANNTSSITVKGIITTTGDSYRGDHRTGTYTIKQGSTVIKTGSFTHGAPEKSTTTLFTVTLTVTHNADGTSGTISASYNYDSGWATGTASKTLTTIPRKSTLTVANGTLGTAQTLTISEKASAFWHKLTYSCGSSSGYILGSASATVSTLSTSWTAPLTLANQNTSGVSVTITFTLYTYTGQTGSLIGSNSYTKTFAIPSSVKPSCSVSVTDPTGYLSTYGGYIKSKSKFNVTVNETIAYGSEITSYSVIANDTTYTSKTFISDEIHNSGTQYVKATVKDKRGRVSEEASSVALTVLDYSEPSISAFKVKRCNQNGDDNDLGDHVKVTISSTTSSLNNKNTATYLLEYKKTSETQYHDPVDTSSVTNQYVLDDTTFIFPAEEDSSYDLRLTVSDNFANITKTAVVSTAFSLMHWHPTGKGMGIGKLSEEENLLDIGFQSRFMGGILQPILREKTDFNDVIIPNTYSLLNTASAQYSNCPISNGTGSLTITTLGKDGQMRQVVDVCYKTKPTRLERYYYEGSWGPWIENDGRYVVLYNNSSGSYGTITLSETAANFKMLEIIIGYADIYGCAYAKVYSPNGKVVDLSAAIPTTTSISVARSRCTISGTSITQSNNARAIAYVDATTAGSGSNATNNTNKLFIKTVIGYR